MCPIYKPKSDELVEALLVPVKEQFHIDKNGKIVGGYNFPAYDEFVSAIESYIDFHPDIPESKKFRLLSDAVWQAAKDEKLDAKNLLTYLKDSQNEYLRQPKDNYQLVGSLSVNYFPNLNRNKLKPPIKFSRQTPKNIDFTKFFNNFSSYIPKDTPESYTFFRIPIKARNSTEAYLSGIAAIDLLRAIWNWFYKPKQDIFTNYSHYSLNFITLGPFHAVINPDGSLGDQFWYEPEFEERSYNISQDWEKLSKFEQRSRRTLSRHVYRTDLENILRRFTQALDYKDKHVAFLQLWQVLEKLTGTNNANYQQLINRTSFLYQDVDLHRGVLNHLRLHRNSSVHDGKQANRIEKYLFQLKGYTEEVIGFHINNVFHAKSLADAVTYLDFPTDGNKLTDKISRLRKALKFRIK